LSVDVVSAARHGAEGMERGKVRNSQEAVARARLRLCAGVFGLALNLAGWTSAARADVLEIAPNGTITTFKGPTLFVDGQAKALSGGGSTDLRPALSLPTPSARAAFQPPPVLAGYLTEAAVRFGVDPDLVHAVAWQESRFDQAAVSSRGAIGMMQLMPATARELGVNPYDARQNIHGGVAYLKALLDAYGGDVRLALAAYNAGPAAVSRYRGIPPFPETLRYVNSIAERLSIR
jgi:Transglycosylase SLT domain